MMTGTVSRQQAMMPVVITQPDGKRLSLEFVVDTGFVGFLTLPIGAVAALGFPFLFDLPINLADDSNTSAPVHEARIEWHGAVQTVWVLATGRRPLLGMSLLNGSELVVQCVEGGIVSADVL